MTNYSFLDDLQKNLLCILNQKSVAPLNTDDLAINYNGPSEERLTKYLKLLQIKTDFLIQAKNNKDEVAMQSALLKIRTHAMSLSSFFDAIAKDATLLIQTGEWPDIPENNEVTSDFVQGVLNGKDK